MRLDLIHRVNNGEITAAEAAKIEAEDTAKATAADKATAKKAATK